MENHPRPGGDFFNPHARWPTACECAIIRAMSMDFETVRFLRFLFALVFAAIGAGAGLKYFGPVGAAGGAVLGAVIGFNAVDLVKGRASK